jgi:hypothetical protein
MRSALSLAVAVALAPHLAAAVPLQVELRLPAGAVAGGAIRARVEATSVGTRADAATAAVTAEAPLPGTVTLDLPPGSTWALAVDAGGYWSLPTVVAVTAEPERATVELLPAGRVAGTVRTPPDQRSPGELILRFRPAPGAGLDLPEVTASCAVAEGRFACTVPAGSLDLRLRARGFLTHSFWGAKVPAGGAFEAGTLALRPGASVVGWIPAPDRELRYEECAVTLQPLTAGTPPSLADAERGPALVQQETVSSRGYFELTGVAPGRYRLTVRHPRFAPAEVAPLDVLPGAETEIHAIHLEPAAVLEVRIEPPRGPGGERWTVTLRRDEPISVATAHEGPAGDDGNLRVPDLAPGLYRLEVSGGPGTRWAHQLLEVTPGMAPQVVQLPFLTVEGEVRLGDEPLAATVWFGGLFGAVRIPARSDDEGRFTVVLPEQDEPWRVEIVNPRREIHHVVRELPVHEAPGRSVARVLLEVPDTTLRGVALDEAGRPVARARILAGRAGAAPTATSRADGTFELRGLEPGDWRLEAEASGAAHQRLHAEIVEVHLEEERPVEDLRLILRPRLALSGQVVGPAGNGIAGALLYGVLDQEQHLLERYLPQATTDVAGSFTLDLPARATGLDLFVLAPGFALRQLRVDARSREPLVLPVHPVGGTVVVTYRGGAEIADALKQLATSLFHERHIPPGVARHWAGIQGVREEPGRYVIPLLEPGPYTACYGVYDQVYRSGRLPAEVAPRCVSGHLAPHGELRLDLPVPGTASDSPSKPDS